MINVTLLALFILSLASGFYLHVVCPCHLSTFPAMEEESLRDKYPLAFRPPSPPKSFQFLTDDELLAKDLPGVDPNASVMVQADQIDMLITEKLQVSFYFSTGHVHLTQGYLGNRPKYGRVP